MEHAFPRKRFQRENRTTFSKFHLFPGIFKWNARKTCVLLTSQPELPEFLGKQKEPLVTWVTITTIHPVFFESDVSLTVVFMVGLNKEGHSRDSKTEKSSGPGYLNKGFLLILQKQNSTHLHNPCNTPLQCKYFEMKTFFKNLCLTNDSFPDTDQRSFEET